MKLQQLSLQAFGPFADEQKIDFTALGQNPLFLIDGPTGAGKSSILHAICYALYGETTDDARKDVGLRCDHANEEILTQVSLTFSIRHDTYQITRVPSQIRKAKRGDGFTEQKPTAHLVKLVQNGDKTEQPQTLVAKSSNEAKKEIEQIIGLTAEQFRQVMVLPQGKFRELLLAKSDARQAILSTLFQTEVYKRIEQKLKDKAGNIEREYKRFEENIQLTLDEVAVDNVEALSTALGNAEQLFNQQEALKKQADLAMHKAKAEHKHALDVSTLIEQQTKLKAEQARHQARKDEIESIQQLVLNTNKALALEPIYKAFKQADNDVVLQRDQLQSLTLKQNQLRQDLQQAKVALTQAETDAKGRDALLQEQQQLKVIGQKFDQLDTLQQAHAKAQSQEQQSKQHLQLLNEKHQELVQRSQKGDVFLNNLKQQLSTEGQLRYDHNVAQQHVNQLGQRQTLQQELKQAQQQLQQVEDAHKQSYQDYLLAEQEANRLELTWHQSQALVLAQELKSGLPCPVCGSSEHPNPAKPQGQQQQISKADIDSARAHQQHMRQQHQGNETKCVQWQETVKGCQKQIETLELSLSAEVKALSTEQAQAKLNDLNRQLTEIAKLQQQLPKAQALLDDLVGQIEPLLIQIDDINQQLPTLAKDSITYGTQLSSLRQEIGQSYQSKAQIEQLMQQKSGQLSELEQKLKSAQNRHSDANQDLVANQAQVEQVKRNLEQLQQRLTEQKLTWDKAFVQSEFDRVDVLEQLLSNQHQLDNWQQQIEQYNNQGRDISSQLALLQQQLKHLLQDDAMPDLATIEQALTVAERAYQQAEQAFSQSQLQLSKLKDIAKRITKLQQEQSENKRQYEVVGTLAKAAGGKGNVRVSLERFVLGDLLDSVLAIASKRLHIMSRGQYQLVRQDEGLQKKNVTAGLDLAIDDAYTGKTRPVSTLSGGESFLASLALALALSDVVQQRSGGIALDTLFIDEGFGSLDQESLQLAIQTLIDLQEGGRTIGIISHVSELKEQMGLRINVTNSHSGSHIETQNTLGH
ncbi:AAA family ATPase [Thalassotalea aquiviva]|uniref:AAA family ATPase n=1 Tax=Thalassotalea aquiviva TaxID=3242415 RepID=UPI00352A2118